MIEAQQRSTPLFVEDVQRECLDRLDETRSPEAVLGYLERAIAELHAGDVAVDQLVERNRVSKPLEGYTQNTQNVAAIKRARDHDLSVHPGQDIEYVVVYDEKITRSCCVGPRRDRIVRSVLLRDTTHPCCRERSISAGMGSIRDTSGTRGDSGTRVDGIRGFRVLTNFTTSISDLLVNAWSRSWRETSD